MTSGVALALRTFGVALGGGEDVAPPVAAHHDEVVAGETVTGGVPGRDRVPPTVGDADPRAVIHGLEAHADLRGLLGREVGQSPAERQAMRRLPDLDDADDEDASGRGVGDVQQPAVHAGLEYKRALIGGEEPEARPPAPPRVELLREDGEGERRLDVHVDGDGDGVARAHGRRSVARRSACALNAASWPPQKAWIWVSQLSHGADGSGPRR